MAPSAYHSVRRDDPKRVLDLKLMRVKNVRILK